MARHPHRGGADHHTGFARTTVLSLSLGVTAALARGRLPLHAAVYGLVLAPTLIPQVVIALGLFLFFEPASTLGSPLAIALGNTVLAAPIAILIMMISTLRAIDERLEDATASMGASRMTIARRISFPLAAPGLIAAAVFSFITSFDEFFIAQFPSTPDTRTLPVLVFNALRFDVDPTVTAVSAVLIALAILALALVAAGRLSPGARPRFPSVCSRGTTAAAPPQTPPAPRSQGEESHDHAGRP
ncbi:ABC transporter permease [Streptomyces sp. NPDC092370]|uniref:ABC transporter permease n=1 Tax=Streptomyces sp. NPDC092370 TaxID=3366016 RepID=UPI0038202DDD